MFGEALPAVRDAARGVLPDDDILDAARLMGAECIISGIRPQIAQTVVHLGVDLQDVITKATLADAFAVALTKLGLAVGPRHATA